MPDRINSVAELPMDTSARGAWMGVLARADVSEMEAAWQELTSQGAPSTYDHLRAPERGLVMVRGRAGGDGAAFNLGEMSVTRCSVRLPDGTVGHGYVAGRSTRHAELAALFDGLLQTADWSDRVAARVIAPTQAKLAAERLRTASKTAATRVEFFTMVREQGGPQE